MTSYLANGCGVYLRIRPPTLLRPQFGRIVASNDADVVRQRINVSRLSALLTVERSLTEPVLPNRVEGSFLENGSGRCYWDEMEWIDSHAPCSPQESFVWSSVGLLARRLLFRASRFPSPAICRVELI